MSIKKTLGTLLILLGVIALFYLFSNQGNTSFGKIFSGLTIPVHEQQTFSSEDLSNIVIDSGSLDVNVVKSQSDEVVVTLDGRASKNVAKDLQLTADQGSDTLTLSLKLDQGFRFGFIWSQVKLTVELPEKSWNKLTAELNSGDIIVSDSTFEDVELRTQSGDIEVRNVSAASMLGLKASSGDIELKDVTAQSIVLDTGSGDVELDRYEADSIQFDIGSGDISLANSFGKLTGETGSGDIHIDVDDLTHDVDLKAGSGDISISLDQTPQSLAAHLKTSSGDTIVRKEGFVQEGKNSEKEVNGKFGNGDLQLNVRTGSGDIILR